MSIKAIAAVWDAEHIPPTQRFVLVALADHADHDGGNMRPAIDTLARKTGLDRSTVKRCLRWLRAEKVIVMDRAPRQHSPAEYHLALGAFGTPGQGAQSATPANPEGALSTARGGAEPPKPSGTVSNTHPSSRGDKKPSKPLPPAVLVMRQAGARPRTDWYDRIAQAIGDSPEALERLGRLVEEWVGRGYNPYNTVGILDAFKAGGNLAGPKPARHESRADREAKMKREQEHYRGLKNGKKHGGTDAAE